VSVDLFVIPAEELPTFSRFLLLALLTGTLRGHDHHLEPRP
jgi:hypothetical protein